MDKRQNSYQGSAGQAKSFAKGAGLSRDWRQSIASATLACILPVGMVLFLSLFRLLRYFFVSILLKLPGLEPVRGSTRIGGLLEGQLEG
jgi:hypothetical protein